MELFISVVEVLYFSLDKVNCKKLFIICNKKGAIKTNRSFS